MKQDKWKPVTSSNPYKAKVVEAIRKKLGFKAKLTNVEENDLLVRAKVHRYVRGAPQYDYLGIVTLEKKNV